MDKMGRMATLSVARMIADLPPTIEWTESEALADTLGVKKVEFKKPVGTYTLLNIYDHDFQETHMTMADDFLQLYGDWDTTLILLVAKAIKTGGRAYWKRDSDLSALLGYSNNSTTDQGVFFHTMEEGTTEFQVKHGHGMEVYSPIQFLDKYALHEGSE